MAQLRRSRRALWNKHLAPVALIAALLGAGPRGALLERAGAQVHLTEMAITAAAGHVIFCVTKDAILIASAGPADADASRPPAIVPLGQGRVAALLGATEWTRDSGKPVMLEAELPAVINKVLSSNEKNDPADQSASDIEAIGVTVLEFIRPLAEDIHHKLNLAPDQPVVELLLADYVPNYGPEIWSLRYKMQQQNLGNDYWQTRPLRPAYVQLYPPEKGRPRSFIEAHAPAGLAPLNLAQAAQSGAAMQRLRSSSPEIEKAVFAVVNGESAKAASAPVEEFLRAALPLAAGPQARLALGVLDPSYRFQWILPPAGARPLTTEAPATQPAPSGQRQQQLDRPSLRRAGPAPADR